MRVWMGGQLRGLREYLGCSSGSVSRCYCAVHRSHGVRGWRWSRSSGSGAREGRSCACSCWLRGQGFGSLKLGGRSYTLGGERCKSGSCCGCCYGSSDGCWADLKG